MVVYQAGPIIRVSPVPDGGAGEGRCLMSRTTGRPPADTQGKPP
ncbi:hypothetical protein [Methanovulcanius yangii]|nr:hypothetical protein [Methanovulcanius yangii]